MVIAKAIGEAPKYTILAANLTWILFHVPDAPKHLVLNNEVIDEYTPPGEYLRRNSHPLAL